MCACFVKIYVCTPSVSISRGIFLADTVHPHAEVQTGMHIYTYTLYKYTHVLNHEWPARERESYYLLVFLETDLHCMYAVFFVYMCVCVWSRLLVLHR